MPSFFLGLTEWIISVIAALGYAGLFLLMLVEGVLTPIPSELIVPFAGYLASQGTMNLLLVVLVATAGATVGSTIAYAIGYAAGRPLLLRYGRFLRLGEDDLRWSEAWFEKYGTWGNLGGHAIPGVRSFISFAAGIGKMRLGRYVISTAIGSAIWNSILAVAGFLLVDQWLAFAEATDYVDVYVLAAAFAVVVGYVYWRKWRAGRRREAAGIDP